MIKSMEKVKEKGPQNDLGVSDSKGYYNNRTLKDWLVLVCWILGVVALGMIAINQTLEYNYKMEFLKAPCKLCLELNPEVSGQCFIQEERLYPNGYGGWDYENGTNAGYVPTSSLNLSGLDKLTEK